MRPAGRLSAAIEVLAEILERHRPASEALSDWGKAHRFAGSGDRAAIGNLVYDGLRRKASAAAQMGEDTPRAIALATAGIAWDMPVEAVVALADGSEHAPPPLTAVEQAALAVPVLSGAPEHALADVPAWAWPSFVRAFGDAAMAEGRAMALRAPADIRVNTLKSSLERVAKSLKPFAPEPTPLAPTGLRVPAPSGPGRTPNLLVEAAFQAGWFEIQDEGSQIAARIAYATHPAGGQVLDLCAGGGGKSLALAALKDNRGQIYAYDTDKHRLAPIYQRLKRAGVRNVQVRAPGTAALDDLRGKLDLVLVDAPCSGTGTWRRRPDSKWRLSPEALARRIGEQTAILESAIGFVKPGGALVYVTCSVLPEENGDQIDALIARHPALSPIDLEALWPAISLAPAPARLVGGRLQLTPHRDGTDGFFVAALHLAK
jgi:16S rRNA (cytosine967-C5)-methyltransferase